MSSPAKQLDYSILFGSTKGYLGTRYGFPVSKEVQLLGKSPFLGLFVEIRSGILENFRFYRDESIRDENVVDDITYWFSWKKFQLSWTFDYPMNLLATDILANLEITPKIGLFDIDSKLPVYFQGPGIYFPKEFKFTNIPNLGIDVGIEVTTAWLLYRPWIGTDISFLLEADKDISISSKRLGVDLYYGKTLNVGFIEVIFSAFGFIENLSIEDHRKDELSVNVDKIVYNLSYIGLGLATSW